MSLLGLAIRARKKRAVAKSSSSIMAEDRRVHALLSAATFDCQERNCERLQWNLGYQVESPQTRSIPTVLHRRA